MVIGLTGGIGSGKSTVARIFELLGAAIFDSDRAGRMAYLQPEVKKAVVQLLGHEAYSADGSVNRSFIAEKVFANSVSLQALNAIIHPAVAMQMQDFTRQHSNQLVIKETALLFESGLNNSVDKVVFVSAPERLRIQRVMKRNQLTEAQVRERMQHQSPEEEKAKRSDFVIYNDEQQLIIPQVLDLYKKLI